MASAYSPEQIDLYEEHISLPSKYRQKTNPPLTIDYLTSLHIHQISAVPYENLLLHYSPDHTVSLDPQTLFTKIISNARGRGGYCLEGSTFFNHVLRALGFQVYTAGVRIRGRSTHDGVPRGDYIGWYHTPFTLFSLTYQSQHHLPASPSRLPNISLSRFHIVNIVALPNTTKYMVDVAFGGDGATKPLPLISGHAVQNLGTQEIRLVYETIPQQIDQSKPLWIYQYRNGPDREWNSYYAFSEHEFLHEDFEIMNYYVSTNMSARNFQTKNVLIVAFVKGRDEESEEGGEKIVGKRMLVNGAIKENMGGRTRLVRTCEGESQRVEVLRELFGIRLTEEEINGIEGSIAELKDSSDTRSAVTETEK
ncbi:arylamine N-acetyltransferase 1 [Sclerotinia borealis F-4128]|uniref:TPA: arylamine N-acetyltransferase 1 n=1 Tax=Sclerotinia borealis (strain F-4128) TaxID=1432307 RepID=W9C635_SCLBF|nr:arylamine N-acetyltransferase 1 [Sclerotinia borealis F-4128]